MFERVMDALMTILGQIPALAIVSVLRPSTTNAMLSMAFGISLAVFGFNLFGDTLCNARDPKGLSGARRSCRRCLSGQIEGLRLLCGSDRGARGQR